MQKKTQVLREVFQITEWKDGCVFKTKSLGYHWIDSGLNPADGYIFAAPSTKVSIKNQTIRRVENQIPQITRAELES